MLVVAAVEPEPIPSFIYYYVTNYVLSHSNFMIAYVKQKEEEIDI